jgi:3'(2'), 5'-bisphosphate nucleotidase
LARSDLAHELEVALRLAHQAGAAVGDLYQTNLAVHRKAGNEPVTEADRLADAIVIAGLQAAFPGDGLLTEESDDDLSRLSKERVWIVDPLDGTSEFLSRTGEFSIQIALAVRGAPVLGVVFQPARDRLFYAVQGQGAYEVRAQKTTRLHVSAESIPAHMRLVASRSHLSPFIESAREALGIATIHRAGSVGIKVSLVACGDLDLYLATTVSKEWDFCAPHALLAEAGGCMTDLCGMEITYNKPDVLLRTGLIASNGLSHEQIVETLLPLRQQAEE